MNRWMLTCLSCLVAIAAWPSAARAAGELDRYRRADALFAQDDGGEAIRALFAALAHGLPASAEVDHALFLRLDEASVRYARAAAERGDRTTAVNAATAGMVLSRRVMERPGADCRDVDAGIRLWLVAEEGLQTVWHALGDHERAMQADGDLAGMRRFVHTVLLPRCEDSARLSERDPRAGRAEARALVRLFQYHLVRIASDNLD